MAPNPEKHTQSDTHRSRWRHGGKHCGGADIKTITWGGEIYMGEGDRRRGRERKKRSGKQTQSEKNAENGTQKTQIKQKENLKCFPGRVCEGGGGGERKWTNKKECVWKEEHTPSSSSCALNNPSGLVGGCSDLLGSAQRSPSPAYVPYPSAQSALCSQDRAGRWHSAKLTHSHSEVCTHTHADTNTQKIQHTQWRKLMST